MDVYKPNAPFRHHLYENFDNKESDSIFIHEIDLRYLVECLINNAVELISNILNTYRDFFFEFINFFFEDFEGVNLSDVLLELL